MLQKMKILNEFLKSLSEGKKGLMTALPGEEPLRGTYMAEASPIQAWP